MHLWYTAKIYASLHFVIVSSAYVCAFIAITKLFLMNIFLLLLLFVAWSAWAFSVLCLFSIFCSTYTSLSCVCVRALLRFKSHTVIFPAWNYEAHEFSNSYSCQHRHNATPCLQTFITKQYKTFSLQTSKITLIFFSNTHSCHIFIKQFTFIAVCDLSSSSFFACKIYGNFLISHHFHLLPYKYTYIFTFCCFLCFRRNTIFADCSAK